MLRHGREDTGRVSGCSECAERILRRISHNRARRRASETLAKAVSIGPAPLQHDSIRGGKTIDRDLHELAEHLLSAVIVDATSGSQKNASLVAKRSVTVQAYRCKSPDRRLSI